MPRNEHWSRIYTTKADEQVSWFETSPAVSLQLLQSAGLTKRSWVLDVGAGDSRLVDHLISQGLDCIGVLDVSGAALERARTRVGSNADRVDWIEADVTADWSWKSADIWHDRAVFHFLTDPADRSRYRAQLTRTLKPGGSAIIATFAPDGPDQCSGLPVVRYSPETLATELGPHFALVQSVAHQHQTPWGNKQSFQYARFVKDAGKQRIN